MKGWKKLSVAVQITLIICITIVIIDVLSLFKKNEIERIKGPGISSEEKIKNIKPPRPGSGIK